MSRLTVEEQLEYDLSIEEAIGQRKPNPFKDLEGLPTDEQNRIIKERLRVKKILEAERKKKLQEKGVVTTRVESSSTITITRSWDEGYIPESEEWTKIGSSTTKQNVPDDLKPSPIVVPARPVSVSNPAWASPEGASKTKIGEEQGIVGASSIPAAASLDEATMPVTAIAAKRGDFANLPPTIDICGFLSGLELPEIPDVIGLIIPTLEEIIAAITGVTERIVGFILDAISAAIGFVGDAIDAIAAAIQSFIPSITCGAPIVNQALGAVSALGGIPEIGAAISPLTEVTDLAQTVIPAAPGGISPVVEVVSPDVTVKSIDDTLDAGEFT